MVYALPDDFSQGITAEAPVPLESWFASDLAKKYPQNLELAKKTLSKTGSESATVKIVLSYVKELEPTAKIICDCWEQANINCEMVQNEFPPVNFDAYLNFLSLPADPDQYALWHSTQAANLSGYHSPKIDKLLEEGRETLDESARLDIYGQFQKAITEDVPVAFLFYPHVYTIGRK